MFKQIKLLTPSKQFRELTDNCLYTRLVYSFLAFRSKVGQGASNRQISAETGIHQATVKKTIENLSSLVERKGTAWYAMPPDGQFMQTSIEGKHWSDSLGYLMTCLPVSGATISYGENKCRFTLSHAILYSHITRNAKVGMLQYFTVAGCAALLGLSESTIRVCLKDLMFLGWFVRIDYGRYSSIRVNPITDEHKKYLRVPEEKPAGIMVEPTGRTFTPKVVKRKEKEGLLSQIVTLSKQLGETEAEHKLFCKQIMERFKSRGSNGNVMPYILGAYKNRLETQQFTDDLEESAEWAERQREIEERQELIRMAMEEPTIEEIKQRYLQSRTMAT